MRHSYTWFERLETSSIYSRISELRVSKSNQRYFDESIKYWTCGGCRWCCGSHPASIGCSKGHQSHSHGEKPPQLVVPLTWAWAPLESKPAISAPNSFSPLLKKPSKCSWIILIGVWMPGWSETICNNPGILSIGSKPLRWIHRTYFIFSNRISNPGTWSNRHQILLDQVLPLLWLRPSPIELRNWESICDYRPRCEDSSNSSTISPKRTAVPF